MLPIFFVGMYWTPENVIRLGLWQHLQVGAALGVVGGVLLPALARGRAEHHLLHSAADALTLFALPLFFCQRSPSQDWSSLIGVDRDVSANSLIVAGALDILAACM